MDSLIVLIIFFWAAGTLVIIRNIFHDTYIWQIKEYRVDRIISHLRYKEESSARNATVNLLQIGMFFSSLIFFIYPNNTLLVVPAIVFGSYFLESLNWIQDIVGKRFIRPKVSFRNILITGFAFVVLMLPILLPINFSRNFTQRYTKSVQNEILDTKQASLEDFLIQTNSSDPDQKGIPIVILMLMVTSILLIATDIASPVVVSFFAITTEPLAQYKRRVLISRAKLKVKKHKNFKIVAITGSYGKSTTKELLYSIIKDNFKTAKTRRNFNSTVGVAQETLNNLEKDTEVFIAEMGAYRKGEIKASTEVMPPDISIITTIGAQHLSLFGSMNNLISAKSEIVRGLKPDGIAILNADNENTFNIASKLKNKTVLFGSDIKVKTKKNQQLLVAKNIEEGKSGLKFTIQFGKESINVKTNLHANHNVYNLLAATAAAMELGMDLKSIAAKINTIDLPQIHLNWKKGLNDSQILDDSYNTNPAGFDAALKALGQNKKGRNIVITRGIIELGPKKKEVYKDLCAGVKVYTDIVITSDKDLYSILDKLCPEDQIIYTRNDEEMRNIALDMIQNHDKILLEGRLAPRLIDEIITER